MVKMFRRPAEFILLLGLVIALPLFEAPKNLLWGAWIIAWLYHRVRDKDYGGPWDTWDSLIALLIVSGYVVAAFAGLHNHEWGGANDILRYGSILWALKRSGYGETEFRWLIIAAIISALIALGDGFWSLFVSQSRSTLELNSVGHVNHSAIYLAITFGAVLAFVMAYWARLSIVWRVTSIIVVGVFAVGVFVTTSRGAVGVMLVLIALMSLVWLRKSKAVAATIMAAVVVFGYSAYLGQVAVVTKYQGSVASDDILSQRGKIWNVAVEAWKRYPLFGVGMSNYNQISMKKVEQWVEASGRTYVANEYLGSSHAHSLYLNTLAERGLFGLGVLLLLLLAWLYSLLHYLPSARDDDMAWMLWGGSFSAWLVTVGVGTVNTTLHHEHAILSMLILGMWLAYLGRRMRPQDVPKA